MGQFAGTIIPALIFAVLVAAACITVLLVRRGGQEQRVVGRRAPGGEPTEDAQKLAINNYLGMSQVDQIVRGRSLDN